MIRLKVEPCLAGGTGRSVRESCAVGDRRRYLLAPLHLREEVALVFTQGALVGCFPAIGLAELEGVMSQAGIVRIFIKPGLADHAGLGGELVFEAIADCARCADVFFQIEQILAFLTREGS